MSLPKPIVTCRKCNGTGAYTMASGASGSCSACVNGLRYTATDALTVARAMFENGLATLRAQYAETRSRLLAATDERAARWIRDELAGIEQTGKRSREISDRLAKMTALRPSDARRLGITITGI